MSTPVVPEGAGYAPSDPDDRAFLASLMRERVRSIDLEIARLRDEAERIGQWLAVHDTPTGQ